MDRHSLCSSYALCASQAGFDPLSCSVCEVLVRVCRTASPEVCNKLPAWTICRGVGREFGKLSLWAGLLWCGWTPLYVQSRVSPALTIHRPASPSHSRLFNCHPFGPLMRRLSRRSAGLPPETLLLQCVLLSSSLSHLPWHPALPGVRPHSAASLGRVSGRVGVGLGVALEEEDLLSDGGFPLVVSIVCSLRLQFFLFCRERREDEWVGEDLASQISALLPSLLGLALPSLLQ